MKKERKKVKKDRKDREKKEGEKIVEKITKDPFSNLRQAVESKVVASTSGVKRKLLEESFEEAKKMKKEESFEEAKKMKIRSQPLEEETIEATSVLMGILEEDDQDIEKRRNLDRFERMRYSERLNEEADERAWLMEENVRIR